MRIYSNNAVATELGDDINESATTIPVGDTTGWPEPSGSDVAVAVIDFHNPATREVVTYTGKTALSLTGVTRGVDGTTARTHLVAPTPPVVVHAGSAADLAQVYTNDGRLDAIEAEPSSLLLGLREVVVFTESGDFEKGDYPWLRAVVFRAVGGGGAGGGATTTGSGEVSHGQGGAGGGARIAFVLASALGSSESVVIGAGGEGVSGGDGDDGGATGVGSLLSCEGGAGGRTRAATSAAQFAPGAPPQGGASSGVGIGVRGSRGGASFSLGGSGVTNLMGGVGGDALLGVGGSPTINGNGGVGGSFGGGGGGAANSASQGTARTGGDGADGIVIVELYG